MSDWEVENNLEASYDCPECDYSRTGVTTSPHAFDEHLMDEHGYSKSECRDVRHGGLDYGGIDSYGVGDLP